MGNAVSVCGSSASGRLSSSLSLRSASPEEPANDLNKCGQADGGLELWKALQKDHIDDVSRILQKDGDAARRKIRTHFGREPPLVVAARGACSTRTLALLLRRGAAADAVGEAGLTALHTLASCATGSRDLWRLLGNQTPGPLEAHTVTNDTEKRCCLRAGCLLYFGASPWVRDSLGRTAKDLALHEGLPLLARFVESWAGMQARHYLRAMWRKDAAAGVTARLEAMPPEVQELLLAWTADEEGLSFCELSRSKGAPYTCC